jgi:ABC-type nitrate/sulfonate/bicarbonate transport system permease component
MPQLETRERRFPARLTRILAIVVFVLGWEILSRSGLVSTLFLPPPSVVARTGWHLLLNGSLFGNISASLGRVLAGFFLATLLAIPLGIVAGMSTTIFNSIDPIIELFRPIPVLALLPLAILWFGIGESSKIFIITYAAFFPIFINTLAGVRYSDPTLIQVASTLGASRLQIFYRVVLMSALPSLAVGIRLGLGFAFLALVAAELIASTRGLGYLIMDARLTFQTDVSMVGIVSLGVLGYAMNAILVRIERWALAWKQDVQGAEIVWPRARRYRNRRRPLAATRIDDDGQIGHRRLDQLFRAMTGRGVEEQGVARFHDIGSVGVAITNLAAKHEDELDAGMAEIGVGDGIALESNEIWFNADRSAQRMSQQIVQVPGFSTAALNPDAFTFFHERAVSAFFPLLE